MSMNSKLGGTGKSWTKIS